MPWDFGSALTGGLAGSALTIFSQWVSRVWLRPRLKILFRDGEKGCCVQTRAAGGPNATRYLRLKVRNLGRSTARGVSVQVTKLTFSDPNTGSRIFDEDVMDLRLSLQRGDVLSFPIAPHGYRFVDLVYVNETELIHHYDFDVAPERLPEQGFGTDSGTYGAEIFAVAENAKAVRNYVTWSWDKTFSGLKITDSTWQQRFSRLRPGR